MSRFEALSEDDFTTALYRIFEQEIDLLIRKRRMYGPHNLTRFGALGIVIRASDKVERLNTLLTQDAAQDDDGEALEDAWRDLIGYATLGLMYTQLNGGDDE